MGDVKRVYRYEVPIDDGVHMLPAGMVVHVDSRRRVDTVEVWIEFPATGGLPDLPVRVFGTGHDVPADAVHLGTTLSPEVPAHTPDDSVFERPGAPRGQFVWHLYAVADPR
jgi:hypothetical protein